MLNSFRRLYLMHKPLAYVNAGVQSESCMTNCSTTCTLHPYILSLRIYDGESFCNTTDFALRLATYLHTTLLQAAQLAEHKVH